MTMDEAVKTARYGAVITALVRSKGNRPAAAARLQISLRHLFYIMGQMRKDGVELPEGRHPHYPTARVV